MSREHNIFKMSVPTYQLTWHNIPEDLNLPWDTMKLESLIQIVKWLDQIQTSHQLSPH